MTFKVITKKTAAGILTPDSPLMFFESELEALRPPPDLLVSQWADDRRILQPGTSREPGPWITNKTPYLRAPMDDYKDPDVRHLVLCFGTQLGKTETLYNILGYIIDLEPYSTLVVYPREQDAKSISRTRIDKMIEAAPSLRAKKPGDRDLYQTLEKHFPGMVLYLVGANSAAALSQKPCRNVLRDEIDKYPDRVGKDADPLSLSEERAKSFWDIRKIVDVSSPTLEMRGIWKILNSADEINRFFVPCPYCGELQKFEFKNILYETDSEAEDRIRINQARESARLICVFCEKDIGIEHKSAMLDAGAWFPDQRSQYRRERVGYHLSSLYSPWITWGDVAAKFLEANIKFYNTGQNDALQNFINGWLAEPWIVRIQSVKDNELETLRTDRPPLIVPSDAIALTAGIDVQKIGFYFVVWAFAKTFKSDLIDYGFVAAWDDIFDFVFNSTYAVEGSDTGSGPELLGIWRAAIDTGGGETDLEQSQTEAVYNRLRAWPRGTLWGIKGLSKNTQGVRVRYSVLDKIPTKSGAKPLPGGLILWLLDTAAIKETFFWRLKNTDTDPQPARFHAKTGNDFFSHILAEEKRLTRSGRTEWIQIKRANHYLDACIYAHACADPQFMGGISALTSRAGEKRLKSKQSKKPKEKRPDTWIGRRGRNWIDR